MGLKDMLKIHGKYLQSSSVPESLILGQLADRQLIQLIGFVGKKIQENPILWENRWFPVDVYRFSFFCQAMD